jgi:hypothetical protein
MSFNYSYSLDGSPKMLVWLVAGNSKTIAVGEAVKAYVAGTADNASAAAPLLGIVESVSQGKVPPLNGAFVPGTATSSAAGTITTASDNATTRKYWVQVDVNRNSVYSVSVSGTLGTTATSPTIEGIRGGWIDVNSAGTAYGEVLETTHTRTVATLTNFCVHGVDPDEPTRLLVSIAASELGKDLE